MPQISSPYLRVVFAFLCASDHDSYNGVLVRERGKERKWRLGKHFFGGVVGYGIKVQKEKKTLCTITVHEHLFSISLRRCSNM